VETTALRAEPTDSLPGGERLPLRAEPTVAPLARAPGLGACNGLAGEKLLLIDVIDAEGSIIVQTVCSTTPDRRAGPRLTRFEKFATLPVLQQRLGELAALIWPRVAMLALPQPDRDLGVVHEDQNFAAPRSFVGQAAAGCAAGCRLAPHRSPE
jgi:hypothetical protein